jgi:tetratricopeptide (TPR) repeat protein
MYLRTPKRYTAKGQRRRLLNLRWLWLYLVAPLILIPSVLAWQFRDQLIPRVGEAVGRVHISINEPSPTPTIPAQDYQTLLRDAFQTGRMGKAVELLKSFAQVVPNDPGVHSLLAQLLVLRGAYSGDPDPALLNEAYEVAQQAINANPESSDGWITMALVLDWSNKPQQALPYALRAKDLDADGKSIMVQAVLAEIYHDLQKDQLAEPLIDKAIKSAKGANPINRAALAHAYYVKARILYDTSSDGSQATEQFEQAWRVATSDPPDPTIPIGYIVQYLNFIYSNTNQGQRAIDLVTKAVKLDKDDPLLAYFLSRLYFNQGDPNKAREYADTCHNIDPKQPRCIRVLATLYYRERNYKQAAALYQQLVEAGSKDPTDYLYGGRAYGYLSQCSSSIPILQRGAALAEAAKDRAAFAEALRDCGSSASFDVETPAATEAATEAVPVLTPTPKKR